MEQTTNFTEGKILSPLIKFSIPILLALFLQAMYGAIDLMVVGQFGDATGVSAVATGSQVMQTITGIITGLTMGITILVGQKIGQKDRKGAADTIGTAILLFTVVAVILTITMLFAAKPMAALMHAPEAAFEKTVEYILVCSSGIIFIVAYNVISGLFRGLGNSKLPLLFVGIACIMNIIGDYVLVGLFHLDAKGAALATVFAQATSVILSIAIIRKKGLGFPFSKENISFHAMAVKNILRLGSPIALQDALTNISFLIITSIVNAMGLIESAAIGVSEKLVVFIMLIPVSFMSSVSAFTAQNIGAGKPDRARKAMYYAMVTALCFGVAMFSLTFFRGDLLSGIFAKDASVIKASAEYMKAYAIDCLLVCVLFCFMGYFNGSGKTVFVMLQGVLAAFLFRIPFSYFVSRTEGATMLDIGFASPVATTFSIVLCLFYYRHIRKQQNIPEADQ